VSSSRNRPGVAQRVPGGLGSQICMTFGTRRWWGRQPHTPAAFTPRNVPGTHFHLGLFRPQGHGTVGRKYVTKNPVTPPGIDPGTVRLVVQRLNRYATPGMRSFRVIYVFSRNYRCVDTHSFTWACCRHYFCWRICFEDNEEISLKWKRGVREMEERKKIGKRVINVQPQKN
jgi:hypothetical protein